MKIGYVLMDNYWQRHDIGSSRIRGRWVIKYLNRIKGVEAEEFVQGKKYDVIVFQKTYWKEMARAFEGIKILDICDPDWLDGAEVISFGKEMDFIICPTEALKEAIENYVDVPVYVIPDSVDLEALPEPKKHSGKAKSVAWFGYSHNLELIYPTFYTLRKMGLTLKIISNGHLNTAECSIENIKWEEETYNEELQKADFALLPDKLTGRYKYKSNNKTLHSWALGLPVAKNVQDVERFMEENKRQAEAEDKYKYVKDNYSTEIVAKKLYEIIKEYGNKI